MPTAVRDVGMVTAQQCTQYNKYILTLCSNDVSLMRVTAE